MRKIIKNFVSDQGGKDNTLNGRIYFEGESKVETYKIYRAINEFSYISNQPPNQILKNV